MSGRAIYTIVNHLLMRDDARLRRRIGALMGSLVAANVAVWLWAFAALHGQAVLLGTAFLAYSFGLRHAVDADHIAAIDNVTRKLMQQGQRPIAVGFFFSLGHSLVVVVMSILMAFAAVAVETHLAAFKAIGSVVSVIFSAGFLFLTAIMNIKVLLSVYGAFRAVRRGQPFVEEDLNFFLNRRGFFSSIFRPLYSFVTKSWHLMLVGFLFGLGFDTATEIGLFGISAAQSQLGASLGVILVFPALFTAGMSLVDSFDGVMMLGAYGWAFVKPVRKLFYNMTITAVSVVVALVIGSIEVLALLADHFNLDGAFWQGLRALDEHWGTMGYLIIGIFVLSWLISVVVYRAMDWDDGEHEEQRPDQAVPVFSAAPNADAEFR